MTVLTLRLAAPMQSWGSSSRFARRDTEMFPTKSGVIGMIAAAMGVRRTESLAQFGGLRFGVRIDQRGSLIRDFHTAHDDAGHSMPLSNRYYLQDAVFLAAIEDVGDERLLKYENALKTPYYQLFLGRRSCPPDGPIRSQIWHGELEQVLRDVAWQATECYQRRALSRHSDTSAREVELIVEPSRSRSSEVAESEHQVFVNTLQDEPLSFDPRNRQWGARRYQRLGFIEPTPNVLYAGIPTSPEAVHDPMTAVTNAKSGLL